MAHEYIAPTPDEIAVGAYHVWEKESRPLRRQKENWLEAETQLMQFQRRPEANPSERPISDFVRTQNDISVQAGTPMPASGKRNKTRLPRVLVVDDEPVATHMLGALLRKHGYIAAELNNPTKAVPLAHRFQPDLLLLDMHMPWKDGHEVAAAFAADTILCCIPIIFITHDARDRNKSTDSIPILVKPFSIEDLFACLGEGIPRPA